VSSYLSCVDSAMPPADEVDLFPQVTAGFPAGMIAVRAADVVRPGTPVGVTTALLAVGSAAVGSGESLVFGHPVVTAPAVVRRGGAVQAGGWLPDHVRLGLLEEYLGDGVIEAVIARAVEAGQVLAPQRRRVMSLELTCRFTLAMVLIPDTDYPETMRRLVGHLTRVPWARPWQVPAGKVFTLWRRRLGEAVMRELFWRAAGSLIDPAATATVATARSGDEGAALWCGMELCAIDGFQTDLPDTPANRAEFGSSGTSDDSAPFPQLRAVLVTARAGRAVLGAAMDASGVGEQTLISRLVKQHPEIFAGRVFLVDRNFLGHEPTTAILDAGGHLVMRVKKGIALPPVAGGWLRDGSRMSYLNAPTRRVADRLPVRVVEHHATIPGTEEVSELYCLASTLLDHQAFPAEAIRDAYPRRWSASETTIGENKTTVTGAGPSTGPILRSGEPALVRQEFWAWLTATQLIRKAAAGAALAATARKGTARPVSTDQISFTTMRREATRSLVQTLVTSTTPATAVAKLAEATSQAALNTLITTGRQRHSARRQKNRPSFPHTRATTPTTTGPVQITRFQREPDTPHPGL
jgi:Insertion element 4 transposase N-terminal/Transposase DDE domain